MSYQSAKSLIREYFNGMDRATPETVADVLEQYTADDYSWRGVYPFRELQGSHTVATSFWRPLMTSIRRMHRRQDIFIAGTNEVAQDEVWVMSMGNFMGLFDEDWLGIRATRKIVNLAGCKV